jgi:protein-tyrosine phosphatase
MSDTTIRICFVCLGNICRSPLAEGVMGRLVADAGLEGDIHVDSAGTAAYHAGEPPDSRSISVALDRCGIALEGRARRVMPSDFESFDWIFAMDASNLRDLEHRRRHRGGKARLSLLRTFDPMALGDDGDIPDPYYGEEDGFDLIYDQIERSCRAFLEAEFGVPADDATG